MRGRTTIAAALALGLALTLAACGPGEAEPGPSAPAQSGAPRETGGPAEELTVYELDGVTLGIPKEIWDKLLVFTDREYALIDVYEKRSYEESAGESGEEGHMGFLFSVVRYDRVRYEQEYLRCNGGAGGLRFFARDDRYYYGWAVATDVQFYRAGGEIDTDSRDWEDWAALFDWFGPIQADFISRNGLEAFDSEADLNGDFFWDSGHVYVNWHSADWSQSVTLTLSQPAAQGEDGIWCVEGEIDNNYGSRYLVLPEAGQTVAEYYAQVQDRADRGGLPELLTPEGAALAWLREEHGGPSVSPDSLRLVEGEPGGNVWGRLSAILTEDGCTLESGIYTDGRLSDSVSYREPDYYQSPTQNLSLASVAGPRLYPLVWVKAEPPGDIRGDAVVVTDGGGNRMTFLRERGLVRVELDGETEWFAPAYEYEDTPYDRMYGICTDWAGYE